LLICCFCAVLGFLLASDAQITNFTGVGQTLLTVFPKDNSTPWQYEADFYSLTPGKYDE
jgi:hypothetical protein